MKTNNGFIGIGIIITIIATLVVVGGGYAVWKGKSMHNTDIRTSDKENTIADTRTENAKKIPFSQFIKQRGSYKCTVHQLMGTTDTTGTTYLDDGIIRADYAVAYGATTINGSAIIRDGFVYAWSSMMPTGFKIPIKQNAEGTMSATTGSYSWNADQIGDYTCEQWNADPSLFVVPAHMTFTEIAS